MIKTLSKKQLENIRQYIEKIKADKSLAVEKIILFGSYAQGNPSKYSDIDLAIISDKFNKNRFKYQVALGKKTIGISFDIEPHPLSSQDLKDPYHSLAQEVVKNGIVLDGLGSVSV